MTKQEIRRELSICLLQGLRDVMTRDSESHIVHVIVKLRPEPDYSKSSNVVINFYKNI
jgi:hypothetical protein